jgi:uncharacterized phage protein (TIGR02220 family)
MEIKDANFVTIQGWMRTKLNLKGNELLVYALIYGFSQVAGTKFTGSRKYVAEWCGCSTATVDRTLTSLADKGLISKTSRITKHGYRAVEYAVTRLDSIDEHSDMEHRTADADDPHTPTDEPQPLINEPQTPPQPKGSDPIEEVVDHLNRRAGTHYKATTANTRKLVKARLKEGFTVDEIKLVIDKKCADWLNNRDMAQYLRPETLFGPKFESYLNAKPQQQQQPQQSHWGLTEEEQRLQKEADDEWLRTCVF